MTGDVGKALDPSARPAALGRMTVRSREEFRRWLADKPPAWGRAIAARAALRVLPLALSERARDRLAVPVFRAVLFAWCRCRYSAHDLTRADADAATAAYAAYAATAAYAAYAAAAAAYAADAADAADATAATAATAAYAADAADAAADAADAADAAADAAGGAAVWASVSRDAGWFMAAGDAAPEEQARALVGLPLWLDDVRKGRRFRANIPPWAREAWSDFVKSRFAKDNGFAPWLAWYRALLPDTAAASPQDTFGEALALRLAAQPEAWWSREATAVNRDIADWLKGLPPAAAELEKDIGAVLDNLPVQAPADFRFDWREDRIVATPPEPRPGDGGLAQDLLDGVRDKAGVLAERLARSNAPPRVLASVRGLLGMLPPSVAALRPGLLLSHSRSLEADAAAFAGAEGELSPDAAAMLIDLAETAGDLKGCFPELRAIETERLALQLKSTDVAAVRTLLDQVAAGAAGAGAVVDPSAAGALQTSADLSRAEASDEVQEQRVAGFALVVRNFLSWVLRVAVANALARAVTETTREIWDKARPKIIRGAADGLGAMAKPTVIVAIASLLGSVLGPAAGVAALLAGFGKIGALITILRKYLPRDLSPED